MAASAYAVLTPYLIPPEFHGRKVVNIGDGFILRAIERLIGHFTAERCFSPRVPPSPEVVKVLEASPLIILAGANQLNDHYSVWPGLTAHSIRAGQFHFVPFGIGLHGAAGENARLSDMTREVLEAIHERIEFSSWRCPRTVEYLERELPQFKGRFLMTGCPVLYDSPLLNGERFHEEVKSVAVTATERDEFWDRETRTLDFVARRFPSARRYLVLHQNYSAPSRFEFVRHQLLPYDSQCKNVYERLRWYAVKRGYQVVTPQSADACIALYRGIDLHIGSRLHAHLLFLSYNKRSFLTCVDGRAVGMAEAFGFPLCDPGRFDEYLNFDFEIVRNRARAIFKVMEKFMETLPK
jgi:hypothetical protein